MLQLFNKRARAIERSARIVGSIYNASAKPTRRFENDAPVERFTFSYSPFFTGNASSVRPSSNGWQS